MSVAMDLLSLPSAIFTIIWDYCEAEEVMALYCTCRRLMRDIQKLMLVVDGETGFFSRKIDFMVPVFFPDHCHSIFLTYWLDPGPDACREQKIVVLSRQRQSKGSFETIVEEQTILIGKRRELVFHISFRNDPTREYLLRHESHQNTIITFYRIQLKKQFMTKSLTPTMKGAILASMNMGSRTRDAWRPTWTRQEVMPFFMTLFVLSFECLSDPSSPMRRFFESGSRTTSEIRMKLLQKHILNLFEQALEQKEPIDCVKKLLISNEQNSSNRGRVIRKQHSKTCFLPRLFLKEGFIWERNKRRRCDQADGIPFQDELVFIARIPLAPRTTALWCHTWNFGDSPAMLYVIFFQKRPRDGIDSSEHSIDGKVLDGEGPFCLYDRRIDVSPEHEACYLYAMPGNARMMDFYNIHVQLEIVLDDNNYDLPYWMGLLLGEYVHDTASVYHRFFPIALFRACALTILRQDEGERCRALKEAFEREGHESTPEGLQYIIETCDALLLVLQSDSV